MNLPFRSVDLSPPEEVKDVEEGAFRPPAWPLFLTLTVASPVHCRASHRGGKLPIIDAIGVSGQMPSRMPLGWAGNARIANVALCTGVEVPHDPVLLLDALYRTGGPGPSPLHSCEKSVPREFSLSWSINSLEHGKSDAPSLTETCAV